MDPLADDLALSPPALSLLAAYDEAIRTADADLRAERKADAESAPPVGDGEAGDVTEQTDAPAARVVAVPRLAEETVEDEAETDAADLHGVLLAAGALDVDLSDVARGVKYRVTRSGRGLLAKAA